MEKSYDAITDLSSGSASLLAESKLSLSMPKPIPLLLMIIKIIGNRYLNSRHVSIS